MPTPTITQLYAQVKANLEAELNATITPFGRAFLAPLCMVLAGQLWLLYLRQEFIQKNVFYDTADSELVGGTLERYGRIKLGRNPFPAVQGKYNVLLTGTTGAVIDASATVILKANDDSLSPGKLFIMDSSFVLDGINIVEIRALEAGEGSKLNINDKLSFTAPIALVDTEVTVTLETVQPQNAEDLEEYRQRIQETERLEPQGGAAADYRLWANEVQGIVQSYPYATSGQTSEIDLYIEADNVDGIPTPTDLDNVQDSIELPTADRPSRKPITAIVNYLPITPRLVDIEIAGFVGMVPTIDPDIEELIYNSMLDVLSNVRPFVGAIDIVAERNDYFDTNKIISTILEARPGSVFGAVTMEIDSVPNNSFTFEFGDIPKLGTITYV